MAKCLSALVLTPLLALMLVSQQATASCPSDYSRGEHGVCWRMACDFFGYDIAQQVSTGEQCGGLCSTKQHCNHFTYNGHTRMCFMKNAPASHGRIPSAHDNVCGYLPGKL